MPHNAEELCIVCNRQARGLTSGSGPLCLECAPLAEDLRRARKFTAYESVAIDAAGAAGGSLLDRWDVTDLATLSEEQWREFIEAVIRGFGASVRKQVRDDAIPF